MRNSFTAHADRSDAIFLNPAVAGRFRKNISAGEGQCIINRLISRIANIPVKKGAGNAGVEVVSGDKRIKCLHVSFPRKIAVSIFYFDSGEETVKLRSAEMCQSRHSGSVYFLSIPPRSRARSGGCRCNPSVYLPAGHVRPEPFLQLLPLWQNGYIH